jgi:hypothetical protein
MKLLQKSLPLCSSCGQPVPDRAEYRYYKGHLICQMKELTKQDSYRTSGRVIATYHVIEEDAL